MRCDLLYSLLHWVVQDGALLWRQLGKYALPSARAGAAASIPRDRIVASIAGSYGEREAGAVSTEQGCGRRCNGVSGEIYTSKMYKRVQ